MDLDDMTPAGGGSLRGASRLTLSEPVATFTPTITLHPDEIWHPRGGELSAGRPWRADSNLSGSQFGGAAAESARPAMASAGGLDDMPADNVGRTVRAALRPGL